MFPNGNVGLENSKFYEDVPARGHLIGRRRPQAVAVRPRWGAARPIPSLGHARPPPATNGGMNEDAGALSLHDVPPCCVGEHYRFRVTRLKERAGRVWGRAARYPARVALAFSLVSFCFLAEGQTMSEDDLRKALADHKAQLDDR